MIILLTAPPKTGKTTCLKNVKEALGVSLCGFIAQEVLDSSLKRSGFKMINLKTGFSTIIAHKDSVKSAYKVGNYSVYPSKIDSFMDSLEKNKNTPCMIDEIGRMQATSKIFFRWIDLVLKTFSFVICTIVYEKEPFAKKYKNNKEYIHLELTIENRDWLPNLIKSLYIQRKYYAKLNKKQKIYFNKKIRYFCLNNNQILADKFTKKTLKYIDGLVTKKKDVYIVKGEHRDHFVSRNKCDCDLFTGKGLYKLKKQDNCSHMEAVKLLLNK